MDLFVIERKLREALSDDSLCRRYYGAEMAKKIKLRVDALRAAASLEDFWPPFSPPERCHELKQNLAGTFTMDVKQPYRLLFEPAVKSAVGYAAERERWEAIKAIRILRIEDTHG